MLTGKPQPKLAVLGQERPFRKAVCGSCPNSLGQKINRAYSAGRASCGSPSQGNLEHGRHGHLQRTGLFWFGQMSITIGSSLLEVLAASGLALPRRTSSHLVFNSAVSTLRIFECPESPVRTISKDQQLKDSIFCAAAIGAANLLAFLDVRGISDVGETKAAARRYSHCSTTPPP